MTNSQSKPADSSSKKSNKIVPILPLELEPTKTKSKHLISTFKLKINPADNDSPTYEVNVNHVNDNSSLREAIVAYHDVNRLREGYGLNADQGKQLYNLAIVLYKDGCKQIFQDEIQKLLTELTDEHRTTATNAEIARRAAAGEAAFSQAQAQQYYDNVAAPNMPTDMIAKGCEAVIAHIAPHSALPKAKRYLRRQCRKPFDMTVRNYATRLRHINEREIPRLPPAKQGQSLSEDEIVELFVWGLPNSWQAKAVERGFEPLEHAFTDVIAFFEDIEAADNMSDRKPAAKQQSSSKEKNSKKSKTGHSKGKGFCARHGPGHSTEDCKELKREREEYLAGKKDSKGKYGNKTWSRKAQDAKDKAREELKAFIDKKVNQKVKKHIHSTEKKKKRSSDESSDSDMSLNAIDMTKFNFDDISDSEFSV